MLARPHQAMRECYLPVHSYGGEEEDVSKAPPGNEGSGAYLSTDMRVRRLG